MSSICEFELSNSNGVYYSGEILCGAIILKTSFAKDIRDIRIIFRGEGKVCWSENQKRKHSDGNYTNESINFVANKLYIDNVTTVHGEGTLQPGTYTYPFEIQLPLECPTACEGRFGHIRYILALMLRRPSRFDNTFSKPLTVIKSQDLNLNPSFRTPVTSEDIYNSSSWFCLGGKITATLSIPFGGYAIGQRIKFTLQIQNQSMYDLNGYSIEFNRNMRFTAHSPHLKSRDDITILYRKTYDNLCKTTRIFNGDFQIVSTPPTTENTGILRVNYILQVILNTGGGCNAKKVKSVRLPIFIGDVPLRESFASTEPIESDNFIATTPTAPDLILDEESDNDLPPSYQELCPPSFEEAIRSGSPFIDIELDEHNRHVGFSPLYPTYS
ncbi:arrestin domain-containing protein 3-like [Lucilia cuprina]|uniref:arrestin domain-containing protein 3-like n=1 Tax=Lucilia cuprina TaxID=7375 RepID=UPI001F066B71|nr:arrestin domain-containing protein 3-like [Lucilia cuprina]